MWSRPVNVVAGCTRSWSIILPEGILVLGPAVKRQSAKTLAQHTLPPPKGLRVFTSTSSDGLGASIGSFGMSSFTADDIDKHLNEFSSHEQKALSRMSSFEETLSREYSDAGADLDYSDIPIFDDDEEFVSTD